MSHFRLLADPDSYIVSDEDLLTDHEARNRWLDQFERHFEMTLATARVEYGGGARARTAAAAKQFTEMIAAIRAEPTSAGQRLGVLELCQIREKALRDNGLHDPFRHVKQRENAAALELYPEVL